MTDTRPPYGVPAGRRSATGRRDDVPGADPRSRPLPPGFGQPAAEPARRTVAPEGAVRRPDADPLRRRGAPESTARHPGSGSGQAASPRSDGSDRRYAPSDIPLSAPPAWQVAGLQPGEPRIAAKADYVRGLPGWLAVLVLLVIAGIGGLIDTLSGAGIKGAFAIGLIVGALVSILAVKRTHMFPVVVAPPLVYFLASAGMLYIRSGGLANRKVLIDAAANWLVYGFPAIAGASAVVLIIAGVRLVIRR